MTKYKNLRVTSQVYDELRAFGMYGDSMSDILERLLKIVKGKGKGVGAMKYGRIAPHGVELVTTGEAQ